MYVASQFQVDNCNVVVIALIIGKMMSADGALSDSTNC